MSGTHGELLRGIRQSVRIRQTSRFAENFRQRQQFLLSVFCIWHIYKGRRTLAVEPTKSRLKNFFLEIFSNDIFILSKGSHTYKWMLYLITKDITEHRSKPHNKPSCVFCIKMNTRRTYTWMIESCIWVWHYSFLRRTVKTYPSSWSFWSARLRLWAMADTPEKSSAMNIRIQRIGQEVVTPVWVKTTETCRLAWVGTLHIAIVSGCSIWTEHDVCSCLLGG